jgi:hypothetical protein
LSITMPGRVASCSWRSDLPRRTFEEIVMLDLIGAIVGMAAVAISLVAFTTYLPGPPARRLILAGIVGGWVGLASALGAAGALDFSPSQPIPLIGVLFATPLLLVGTLALIYPGLRAALLAVPMPVLIALNAMRVFGVLFLLLTAAGRLSGPFPWLAGFGDIITGALAVPLAMQVARSAPLPTRVIARWNMFGILDLFVAVGLGITSAAGSPLRLIHMGVGSQAMQQLPFCLVPAVLVPFYLITHGIIAAQLRAARVAREQTNPLPKHAPHVAG